MKDSEPIKDAIRKLEARISTLKKSLEEWDRHSVNKSGATAYKEQAKQIVFQAQTVQSRISERTFPERLNELAMPNIIQTNPAAFSKRLPIYTVTAIDRDANVVTLSGPGGSVNAPLDLWGTSSYTQPSIGSQVQIIPDEE